MERMAPVRTLLRRGFLSYRALFFPVTAREKSDGLAAPRGNRNPAGDRLYTMPENHPSCFTLTGNDSREKNRVIRKPGRCFRKDDEK